MDELTGGGDERWVSCVFAGKAVEKMMLAWRLRQRKGTCVLDFVPLTAAGL